MNFEGDLRRALEPVDPPPGFADDVLARLGTRPRSPAHSTAPPPGTMAPWLPLGLAASLLAAVLGGAAWLEQERQRQAAEARDQVIQALRLTSHQLNEIRTRAVERAIPINGDTP
jgi:hypothetical protein